MENKITLVEVIGPGCANCKKLHGLAQKAVKELGLDIEVAYSGDIQKALKMGAMQFPVLAVNGKAVLAGAAGLEKIKKALAGKNDAPEVAGCRPCGGDCGC